MGQTAAHAAQRADGDADHVVVLLATCNGAHMLGDQLRSLAVQTHANWSLIVSDDGSTDTTRDLVRAFAQKQTANRITLLRGAERGAAQNFLSLLRAAGSAPYVAFCDQDDFWFAAKLENAVRALAGMIGPVIYGTRTLIADANLRPMRQSLRFRRKAGFGNALVQNIAGGNTMVINRHALDILQPASQFASRIVAHDWWCYQMVTGAGGRMVVDPRPSLFYRQHDANLVGANDNLTARLHRLQSIRSGQFAEWIDLHIAALDAARAWLTPKAERQLDSFAASRQRPMLRRMNGLRAARVYRQTIAGTLALWGATALGWM